MSLKLIKTGAKIVFWQLLISIPVSLTIFMIALLLNLLSDSFMVNALILVILYIVSVFFVTGWAAMKVMKGSK